MDKSDPVISEITISILSFELYDCGNEVMATLNQLCNRTDEELWLTDALLSSLGLQLVGPYDVLAGKTKRQAHSGHPNYLLHWRYYYDPPEFLTVVRGDDKKQFHIGYYR